MPLTHAPYKLWFSLAAVFFLVMGLVTWYLLNPGEEIEEPIVMEESEPQLVASSTIGYSVNGRIIEAYTYGNGPINLLFVGGVHGGYEWNSVVLAYRFIDYMEENVENLTSAFTIHVIPSLNPDGVYEVVGKEGRFSVDEVPAETGPVGTGRFNANGVDLNRNFACKWQPESRWRGETVSAGSAAFSEPEAAALRDYVYNIGPKAVVFWHSQANAVYASECEAGVLPTTISVMNAYAKAAGYKAVESFDAYPVSGDAEGWLASVGIPAITVELSSHDTVEWAQNKAGIEALFSYFTNNIERN